MGSAYMTIIDAVIKQLENGIIPWKAAYNIIAKSHSTGIAYSLLNQLLLKRPGEYWTFNQVQEAKEGLCETLSENEIILIKPPITRLTFRVLLNLIRQTASAF